VNPKQLEGEKHLNVKEEAAQKFTRTVSPAKSPEKRESRSVDKVATPLQSAQCHNTQ
jgi:hypothetical protein